MPIQPRLPSALRSELDVKDKRRPKKRNPEDVEPRKKRKLYQREHDYDHSGPASSSKSVSTNQRSILKKTKKSQVVMPKTRDDILMDQDDAEIDYWEAKLGLKKSADQDELEDGLDDIFQGLTLPRGPSRLEEATDDEEEEESGSEGDMQDFLNAEAQDDSQFESDDDNEQVPELVDEEDGFTNFEDEETMEVDDVAPKTQASKSSIYLPFAEESEDAPSESVKPAAYVPPALRNKQPNAEVSQLRRQLKGLLNRLSAVNIATIVTELETMYRNNPRGIMNEELSSLLLDVVSDKSGLLDTFVILHAALIAALYKSNGIEFAASFIQKLVEAILAVSGTDLTTGRRAINLMSLVAELYTLNIIAATLPYDFIRELLTDMNELNAEILLVIIKNSGSQLRSDDPSALKDILNLLQTQMKAQYADLGKDVPLRLKFMVDALLNLKNNKPSMNEGQQAKDLRIRMKKYIGGLNTSSGKSGGEPLRVSLDDIKHVESRGKWWLVGASWRNQTTRSTQDEDLDNTQRAGTVQDDTKQEELLALAKQHRLNNPIRKQIFITILSASDYLEAITGVLSLRLKKSQESEIARVLLLLVGSEERYNPYYTYIAKGLADRHGMRISLQFCLWDFLRDCGEDEVGQIGTRESESESGGSERPSMRKVINVAKFFGTLLGLSIMPITVLKTLTFSRLQVLTRRFLDILMTQLFLTIHSTYKKDSEIERHIVEIFSKVRKFDAENKNAALKDGIEWFLRKVTGQCAVVTGASDTQHVKNGVEIARIVLST